MKKLLFVLVLLAGSAATAVAGALMWLIFLAPAEHLDRERIRQSVLTESTVYYRDGKTKVGAFFDKAHRNYLSAPSPTSLESDPNAIIPPLFLRAIVASEDQDFYRHVGLSFTGIARAIAVNVKAGRVVQGASTLTQQTSELLFEHRATTQAGRWREKVLETINAFRLEWRYPKIQILEYYSNLFHVHGTGQGLAIAARFYFDKEVSRLNLAETAFIAGSVKGPALYTPFGVSDPKKLESILHRAFIRRNYVLYNMLELGHITQAEHDEASRDPVAFRQGSFRFEETHQMDAVRRALSEEPIKSKLAEHGLEDLSRAEIKVYTTLDAETQARAEYALSRHLSDLEFRIRKYAPPAVPPYGRRLTPAAWGFYVGEVESVSPPPAAAARVRVGAETAAVAGADLEEFARRALRLPVAEKVNEGHLRRALALLAPGDAAMVSLKPRGQDGLWPANVEMAPSLNGGVFVMQEGEARAFAGGFENRGFNRALDAKRQPGSTFKLLVYAAALHLGWRPMEPLPNERRVYHYQGQFYYPRPDHRPPDVWTDIVWAGAKSENLATIYLLYHLLDHLDQDQFHELTRWVDLAKRDNESEKQFQARLRDREGVIDIEDRLRPGVFELARVRLRGEFQFDDRDEELAFDRLFLGQDWKREYDSKARASDPKTVRERQLLLENHLRLREYVEPLKRAFVGLKQAFDSPDDAALEAMDPAILRGFYVKPRAQGRSQTPPLAYSPNPSDLGGDWRPLTAKNLALYKQFWNDSLRQRFMILENVHVGGRVKLSLMQAMDDLMAQMMEEARQHQPYTPARLYRHQDYRVLVALRTVVKVAQIMGVRSELRPVLSLPLGANEVSLDELALMYQTYMTGDISTLPGFSRNNGWRLIDRVEDAKGRVIYQESRKRVPVFAPEAVAALRETLRSVVEYGTGKSLQPATRLTMAGGPAGAGPRVPTYGKTGTANNYTNATFAGFVPALDGAGAATAGGHTIAAYVGADILEGAKPPPFKLTGSTGALPVWGAVANHIVNREGYRARLDLAAAGAAPKGAALPPVGALEVPARVSPVNGLPPDPMAPGGEAAATAEVHLEPAERGAPRRVTLFDAMPY